MTASRPGWRPALCRRMPRSPQLEMLRYRWRGDVLELKTLRKLGALYFGKQRWHDGLQILRTASQNFPSEDVARQAQDDMRDTFETLFLKGKADSMPPVAALSLFYDFIDLTPIGPNGDEMIRRMADRLVAVDLSGSCGTASELPGDQAPRRYCARPGRDTARHDRTHGSQAQGCAGSPALNADRRPAGRYQSSAHLA